MSGYWLPAHNQVRFIDGIKGLSKAVIYRALTGVKLKGLEEFCRLYTQSDSKDEKWKASFKKCKERFAAATTVSEEEVLFTTNYRADINTTHVIRYNNKLYDITRVYVFEGYKEDITLYCKTRVR